MRYLWHDNDRKSFDDVINKCLEKIDIDISEIEHRLSDFIADDVLFTEHYCKMPYQFTYSDDRPMDEKKLSKKELRRQKINVLEKIFLNFEKYANNDTVISQFMGTVDKVDTITFKPGEIYFNDYVGLECKHYKHRVARPTLITDIFVNVGDTVYHDDMLLGYKFIDINPKLESIIRDAGIKHMPFENFQMIEKFYNWCEKTGRYKFITTRYICKHLYTKKIKEEDFEDLYVFCVDEYAKSNPSFYKTSYKSSLYPLNPPSQNFAMYMEQF